MNIPRIRKVTQIIHPITQKDTNFPASIGTYLKADTPEVIWARGNIDLLSHKSNSSKDDLWALFCSSKCPAEIILKTHDLAQEFKEVGVSTISGFHSPIEKECLRVLLRGSQPIILSPARSIEKMQWLSSDCQKRLSEDRLLILSIFENEPQQSVLLARPRNLFVAALASKIFIAHAAEDSKTLEFTQTILKWGKPVFTFDSSSNKALIQLGVKPYSEVLP
ncbi:MAG: DNA-processing protein DprA [Candidatus Poribacteria bacterium]|nr:DNA-processing protein DprA [Candidatus Poribacteria bacterium]